MRGQQAIPSIPPSPTPSQLAVLTDPFPQQGFVATQPPEGQVATQPLPSGSPNYHILMMSSDQPSQPSSLGPSPSAGTHEPLYPPGMVPPSLSHLGAIPPGHYPSGQIPFLAPPPGVSTVPVMATLSLPNLTLGILVSYLDPPAPILPGQPKPYLALTLVQPVPMTSPTATMP